MIMFTFICKKSTGRFKEIFIASFSGIEKDEKQRCLNVFLLVLMF